jgi:translation initiation factor IF-2
MTEKNKNLVPRPPVIVVMGHIDHGKTTLLDYIRKTKVTEKESGGITQHIGAYEIEAKNRKITFLDTPGHEAFSKIRSRGAKIADIAVLVIAADDGLKAQTEEALAAIKEAGIPQIIAINKIDKENANPERVKKELSEKAVQVEEWGGKIPSVNISAKTGQGINELLEMMLLVADMEDLKTDPGANASGFVLESHIDQKRGISAALLVQNGVLKQGMCVVSEDTIAAVRIFEDFLGKPIKEARASSPVKIIGFNKIPQAGAKFESFVTKKEACDFATITLPTPDSNRSPTSVDQPKSDFGSEKEDKVMIPIIIKADAIGSVEALKKQINKIQSEKVVFNILRMDVGEINEDDVKLASSGGNAAIIIGFHVNCPHNIKMLADRFGINIRLFDTIYEAEEWLEKEVKKREPKEEKIQIIGKAKVLKIFRDEKNKKIIGGKVVSGKIVNGKHVKILRRDFLLGEGKILELQQQKTKTNEINEGEQFGALLQTKVNLAPQDNLEIIDKVISNE